jgi:hypothetical protein
MRTPREIREGLAVNLNTIDGLRVYPKVPEKVNELPAAVIMPESGTYDLSWSEKNNHLVRVQIFVKLGDLASAEQAIDPYFESVPDAVNTDPTLDGNADSARVLRYEEYGIKAAPGSLEPNTLGVDFLVEVIA